MKTLCASWITKWTCKEINQCKKELLFKKFHFLQYVNWGGIKFDWLVFLRAIQRPWGQNYSRTVCSWSSNQALVMEAFSFHSVEWALLHVIHTHSCRCKQTSSTAKSLPFIPQLSYCAWRGPVGSWLSQCLFPRVLRGTTLVKTKWPLDGSPSCQCPEPSPAPAYFPICQHWQVFLPSQAGHWNTNWHWRYHSLSSTRAGRHHDSSDSSVKKCQEWSSGMPSADCSTLALMSSLSAPASGAPCGTGIIRIADEKNFSSKRSSEEREGAQSVTNSITLPMDGNHLARKDQKIRRRRRKEKDIFIRSLSMPTLDNSWNLILIGLPCN